MISGSDVSLFAGLAVLTTTLTGLFLGFLSTQLGEPHARAPARLPILTGARKSPSS